MTEFVSRDSAYVEVLLSPIRTCMDYKPAFGQKERDGLTLEDFHCLYGRDPLYHWVGMDSDFMYAAHKAAGGMTSIYRQLGTGCERLLRQIILDHLALKEEQINWSYDIKESDGTTRTLTLDARIDSEHVVDGAKRAAVSAWTAQAAGELGFSKTEATTIRGSVFEIRQGYKSQDSKRQNADMQSAMRARTDRYIFVMAIMSSQISDAIIRRYQNSQMLVLVGDRSGNPLSDTFAFVEKVIGYPIVSFFERNTALIRREFESTVKAVLSPE